MENKKTVPSRPGQMVLILRLIAGLYLVYLAKELVITAGDYSGGRLLIQFGCIAVFACVGAIFAGWSLKKLVRKEYLRPGEEQETEQEAEQ